MSDMAINGQRALNSREKGLADFVNDLMIQMLAKNFIAVT
jgi:hypothetical protein